ncbi:deoxyribodipyrimidine photo-lyase [Actinocorallia sp. A-T 12471]|uniref:cryptochrome/photolyase family protein n=1 Tax=Actinocorallia sp. A-T 12471 TaxID=3089813 RepID=UPI0029CF950F|nr:deoxyribodipyrimidine photo-lyase [Actinocorallia sp. A-T 12471]MDX6740339.1 deoxyribodipyrimidine photo-lyase [Actinocorallia sp. A-T 12471]
MNTSIMLFTRDLRLHDNPALTAACAAGDVVPLFVADARILSGPMAAPNRLRFLADALADLREALRAKGADLIVREGDPAQEVARLAHETGATSLHLADDRSRYALSRLAALRDLGLDVTTHPGTTVVPTGDLRPTGGDHYKVFTPYWRAWAATPRRDVLRVPRKISLPDGLYPGELPDLDRPGVSPALAKGGESEARRIMKSWLTGRVAAYDDSRDLLSDDKGTSHLSAHLRFGCASPLELAVAAADHPAFTRQLAWRDFHHQVAAAFPDLSRRDYRPRGTRWRSDDHALKAWEEGRTGVPIVDAGMRQLRHEGYMHNRARLITASYLTRDLGLDWRLGYRCFRHWLADGDLANNPGNWQWVAGTGNDTRPNRTMNPLRQADRYDPDGVYVRRWVPELADLPGRTAHRPWDALDTPDDYPPPLTLPNGG